jgi:hypothetical protein
VGSTALAVHRVHRHRQRFPDGQLYVDLHGYSEQALVAAQATYGLARASTGRRRPVSAPHPPTTRQPGGDR